MTAGWQSATLKDICVVDWGNTSLTKSSYVEGGEFLAVSAAGCDGRIGHREHFRGTPVLSAIGAQCGKMFFPQEDFTAIKNTITLTPRPEVCTGRFLYYLLTFIELPQRGAGQPFISKGDIQGFAVLFPQLQEQQRIATILDEAFEGIATAKANAEKSLHNARELLAVATRQAFDALGERCEARLLGSVCRFENGDRGKNYPGKEHRVAQGIPFINAGHLTPTGIDFAEMDYISPERFALLGNGKVQPMDVLFCLRGSLGKYASVGDLSCGAIASSLVILRPTVELDHEYLLCFLGSTLCTEQIEAFKGGAAQPNLGAKDLKQFAIPLPPIDEQRLTAARILELQDRISDLLKVTTQKLAALDELKKSLLHQAFSGQL